ncbi:hypothetical protein [Azospirillum canadense]|uniref:hypothetical protein n=1 Tax=Azospirillum canadense TaxID=403962 RepID=UPI00222659ED|nr:hypothetical protein [Azospirillum canadense]MCW2242306.1 hypothetical protein [Azospirillum canadense]
MTAPQPFSFSWRNPGHWDVIGRHKRLFRIRGEGRQVVVIDERPDCRPYPDPMEFPSVAAATAWITETLMAEPVQDGSA